MTPRGLLDGYRRFGGEFCLNLQGSRSRKGLEPWIWWQLAAVFICHSTRCYTLEVEAPATSRWGFDRTFHCIPVTQYIKGDTVNTTVLYCNKEGLYWLYHIQCVEPLWEGHISKLSDFIRGGVFHHHLGFHETPQIISLENQLFIHQHWPDFLGLRWVLFLSSVLVSNVGNSKWLEYMEVFYNRDR